MTFSAPFRRLLPLMNGAMRKHIVISLYLLPLLAPVLKAGAQTNGVAADSSIIRGWALSCRVQRGYINIADTTARYTHGGVSSNRAFFGADSMATGPADGTMSCVSLGDGGTAVLQFSKAIGNGEGPDFAVFENAYEAPPGSGTYFIELAFVEVSSDGHHYVRFPALSLGPGTAQVGSFAPMDPETVSNLAGKHPAGIGTAFDLEELKDSAGIDINHISHVRIVDAVGCIDPAYATYDSQGNKVNDPWPTPFHTGGFDLDALGVIHYASQPQNDPVDTDSTTTIPNMGTPAGYLLYPNPASAGDELYFSAERTPCHISLYAMDGTCMLQAMANSSFRLPAGLPPGIYYLHVSNTDYQYTQKLLVR